MNQNERTSKGSRRDVPALIKYALLVLLIILLGGQLATGEMTRLAEGDLSAWLILVVKLLLIGLLVQLIRAQRDLRCEITAPDGCEKERPDTENGILFVPVEGTATGGVFGSYTLEVRRGADVVPDVVRYPGGGTSGGVRVVGGELGRIDTTSLTDGAYTVTLTVHPAGAGSPKVCEATFNLLKAMVLIEKVGAVPAVSMDPVPNNPNPLDPDAELRKEFADSPPPHDFREVAVGGNMSIDGMAYIYGCSDRRITRYEIRHTRVTSPGGEPAQPATGAAIPGEWAPGDRIVQLEYTGPERYRPWTRLGPGPSNLIRVWDTASFLGGTWFYLKEEKWHSRSADSGRYSLLLTAEDSSGVRFHDIQHIWLDNWPVHARITGIRNVDPCAELRLSQFTHADLEVLGIAWDRLIDEDFPDTPPNDNFDRYSLTLVKQGGGRHEIGTFSDRVIDPAPGRPSPKTGGTPTDDEADTLATFDVATTLDADDPGSDPDVSLPRGESCGYYLRLHVRDDARLNDDGTVHSARDIWPFCIVNDLQG